MSKRSYITLKGFKRSYKLFSDDIAEIHKAIHKKRPHPPPYDVPTQDDSEESTQKFSQYS